MADKTGVTVADGWAVYANGQQHHGGQTIQVDDDTAQYWIARGWATPAPRPTPRRRRTTAP